jgi:manganese efflux pump family protein
VAWAALITWVLAVAGGGVLAAQWIRHGGLRQRDGIRSARLGVHALLAIAGLVLWVAYLIGAGATVAWLAIALVAATATIGVSMLLVWWRGESRSEPTTLPAEASFPLPLILGHGLLAASTLVLATLAAAGIGA